MFPDTSGNCEACHLAGSYELPLATDSAGNVTVLPTTVNTVPLGVQDAVTAKASTASLADSSDDRNISPTASVCSACHDTALAQVHMAQNGAQFDAFDMNIGLDAASTEACAICHGAGRLADVREVHGIR